MFNFQHISIEFPSIFLIQSYFCGISKHISNTIIFLQNFQAYLYSNYISSGSQLLNREIFKSNQMNFTIPVTSSKNLHIKKARSENGGASPANRSSIKWIWWFWWFRFLCWRDSGDNWVNLEILANLMIMVNLARWFFL